VKNAAVLLNADELILSGEVHFPDECKSPQPAVCICHGIPAAAYNPNERGGYTELAARFCQAGFVAMTFNFRGCGPSQGNIDMVGWTHDLTAAIDFLDLLPEVDSRKICLLGSSGGAAVSVCVAATDRRVAAVALLACPAEFDFLHAGFTPESIIGQFRSIGIIKDEGFPQSVDDWLDGFRKSAPIKYVDKIAPRPLLIIHGDVDETVPVEHAEKLYARAGNPKEKVIIPGGAHRLRLDERAVSAALNWLKARAGIA
jgi:dipeptidyl aminopeptidase/acylaminoacyl peptidase